MRHFLTTLFLIAGVVMSFPAPAISSESSQLALGKHHARPVKRQGIVMPVGEIQAAMRAYIARTVGDAQGLSFPAKPQMGQCSVAESCEDIWYTQRFLGPHGEIGGQAIVTSTIKRPSIFSVITLAAGAANTIEGFAAFDVPTSAARELLRPQEHMKQRTRKLPMGTHRLRGKNQD